MMISKKATLFVLKLKLLQAHFFLKRVNIPALVYKNIICSFGTVAFVKFINGLTTIVVFFSSS